MVRFEPISLTDPRPIRDIVYETLRKAILEGRSVAGDRLVETPIARQLGVSRTPVREALRMLIQDGLIVAIPRRGIVVAGLNKDDAIETYDLRAVIEGLSARLAATRITASEIRSLRLRLEKMRPESGDHKRYISAHAEFNSIIIGASRSHRIAQIIDTLSGQIRSLRGVSLATRERQLEAWKEHVGLVDALEARDAERAEALARQHVENAKWAFLGQWR